MIALAVAVLVVVFVAVRDDADDAPHPRAGRGAHSSSPLPLPRTATAGLAFLVALMEVGVWIVAAGFDFDDGSLQLGTLVRMGREPRHLVLVGFYGFSLWLAGATVIVSAAAIGYALWVGRDRPRAYHALMLFLSGAVIATFAAHDLLLFYVSFEALLIPLYILVGVWGGRRLAATLTFVVYIDGRLAADARLGRRLRRDAGDVQARRLGDERQHAHLPRLRGRVRDQGAALPLPRLAPDPYREAPVEVAAVLSAIVSKTAIYGFLRIGLWKFPGARRRPHRPHPRARRRRARVRVARVPRARPARDRRVLVDGADGPDRPRRLRVERSRDRRRGAAVGRACPHLGEHVPPRRDGRAALWDGRAPDALGGMARGRPLLATMLISAGIIAAAVPGSATFAGEFLIMAGAEEGWGYRGDRRARDRPRRDVHAAADPRRPPRAARRAVRDEALDLRPGEPALVLPLVACLLVPSAWPALVSQSSFPDDRPVQVIMEGFPMIETPSVDWFAPHRRLRLGAAGVALMAAVLLLPWMRKGASATIAFAGFVVAVSSPGSSSTRAWWRKRSSTSR